MPQVMAIFTILTLGETLDSFTWPKDLESIKDKIALAGIFKAGTLTRKIHCGRGALFLLDLSGGNWSNIM